MVKTRVMWHRVLNSYCECFHRTTTLWTMSMSNSEASHYDKMWTK